MEKRHYQSPIGWLEISSTGEAITSLTIIPKPKKILQSGNPVVEQCCKELDEYFCGKRRKFTVPLSVRGTSFQERVWENLLKIPYGKTISYTSLAEMSGNPKAYRAAGSANGKNPIAIIIPCHRVIALNGGPGVMLMD